MPYSLRKVPRKSCYKVYKTTSKKGSKTKKVFAKCTSLKKAKAQLRLLRAIQYNGFVPTRKSN